MIRTGILGKSDTAHLYAGILQGSDKFELTGCFSPDYVQAKIFAAKNGLVAYPSVEALLNYTDALIITDFHPDFLLNTEKAIKSFKHVLITNPFLAGLDEIQQLQKLSEESGVFMQICGGFKFTGLFPENETRNSFFVDLIHTFDAKVNVFGSPKFMEYLLCDISLLLILLKGMAKKININSWDVNDSIDLLNARIELDNGCIANILFGDLEDKNEFNLKIFGTKGVNHYEIDPGLHALESFNRQAANRELAHLEKSIRNRYLTSVHNDVMFQALELVHKVKAKTSQKFVINTPD